MGTETRADAYGNVAGLLSRMGYAATVREGYTPAGRRVPVTALVTDAPEICVGMAFGLTAEDPEANLPTTSAWAGKSPAGDKLLAWF